MSQSTEKKRVSEVRVSVSDTKDVESSSAVLELRDGDEALKLVGAERSARFSEEYNARLRRKLVFESTLKLKV